MKFAIVQLTSVYDYKENLKKISSYLKEASLKGASYAFLPECFYSLSNGEQVTEYLVKDGNEHYENIKNLCIQHKIGLIGGSVAYRDGDQVKNRSLNFDINGNLLGFYDKNYLFNCKLKNKSINEADIYTAGKEPLIIEVAGLRIGVAICFDLRFPEFLQYYYKEKVDLITFSSAFTVHTGKAHWHTLLKARAIEGQCYVVASAQVGQNNEKVSTYGHSLIIDSWGKVLFDMEKSEGVHVFEVDKEQIEYTRKKIQMRP